MVLLSDVGNVQGVGSRCCVLQGKEKGGGGEGGGLVLTEGLG